jgi:hypothetical protein
VPKETTTMAAMFLDSVQSGTSGGLYSYQPGSGATAPMTAEGLLCRQYLGWPQDHAGLQEGVKWLLDNHLPHRDRPNFYYWYYGTQVMHHVGGEPWKQWNTAFRQALLETQDRTGHQAGSWPPRNEAGDHGAGPGGRLYFTSLAICMLEVFYRHMPLYRTVEIE